MIIQAPQQQQYYAEAGRWYNRDGQLVEYVPYKDKSRTDEMKRVTLREAKELNLFPSVTTIISLLDRPALDDWKVRVALEAHAAGLTVAEAIEEMRRVGKDAADFGSQVHAGIESRLTGKPLVIFDAQVKAIVDAFMGRWYPTSGLVCEQAEHSFLCDKGYAGTCDFEGTLNGEPVLVDFKTEDAETVKDFTFHTPEYPLQLAAYDVGLGCSRKRISVKISRNKPGLVATKLWEDNHRWDSAWLALWEFWQLKNAYHPQEVAV